MNQQHLRFVPVLLVLGLLLTLLASRIEAVPTERLAPAGANAWSSLSPLAQGAIAAAVGRAEGAYHAVVGTDAYWLRNPAHELTAEATAAGFEIQVGNMGWRLALSAWGYGEQWQPVEGAAPQASGNRVEYRRGDLTEWYVVR
jgi:hypothetical protein